MISGTVVSFLLFQVNNITNSPTTADRVLVFLAAQSLNTISRENQLIDTRSGYALFLCQSANVATN